MQPAGRFSLTAISDMRSRDAKLSLASAIPASCISERKAISRKLKGECDAMRKDENLSRIDMNVKSLAPVMQKRR